jgi:eukaryotic-like serine/threonine-protein kinase
MSAAEPSTPTGGTVYVIADRFRVVARVGLGGTAVVYRCVDERTGRFAAVKVLRTQGPQIPEAAGRFRREARLAASLSHRHIVRVLDSGHCVAPPMPGRMPWATDDGQQVPYVAMEYVFGPNLKDVVRKLGPLPLSWVWRLGDQLCAALGAAHALGVVHRDVKPQNVMLVDSALELLTKLTDFGIARQVGGDYTTLTVTGQVLGTPDYLSPEQVMGEPGDPSSDLYALGIVLYELLTGRLPFEADSPLAAASRRMVADALPPNRHRAEIPPDLVDIVMLTLQRDPAARPATAAELRELLRWSRRQSPYLPEGPAGGWLVRKREPTQGPAVATPHSATATALAPAPTAEVEDPGQVTQQSKPPSVAPEAGETPEALGRVERDVPDPPNVAGPAETGPTV